MNWPGSVIAFSSDPIQEVQVDNCENIPELYSQVHPIQLDEYLEGLPQK